MSDKETAPQWAKEAAEKIWRLPQHYNSWIEKTAQIIAAECMAPAPQLSFEEFQRVNKHRCETKFHQCETWLPSGWPLAIAGEAGELCNLIKKIIRGDFTFESKRGEILEELADVIIYSDLMISAMGASTSEVVAAKFDEVSRRVNYTGHVFAEAAPPQVTPTSAAPAPQPASEQEAIMDYDVRPFSQMPEDQAAHVAQWLRSNKKKAAEVRWSLYPIGMVGRWIERAICAGKEAATPQVTSTLKEILKQYGAHHIRDCDALNKWTKLPCNCGFAALIEGTSEQAPPTPETTPDKKGND